jgi:hypothetical protein
MQDKQYPIYARDISHRPNDEIVAEHKERIAAQHRAEQADKEVQLSRQRSVDTPPATRIALWESRHGLAMPRDSNHPLISLIALGTGLKLEQVLAEHHRRYAEVR